MRVADLPLADRHVAHFEGEGIEELYPPQTAAVEAGVCDGESVVAAVPTASGKTLIAQLAALTADGPASHRAERGEARRSSGASSTAVYVVPLRALATEKAETLAAVPGVDVGVSTGDFDAAEDDLAGHDVVVATAEKVDAAIRQGAGWVERIACAVLDEVHLLDDPGRGPTLEVTIAKLRRLNPDVQLVALSATVPNAGEIADWLDAATVRSEWRPVSLRTGIYADGTLAFEGEDEERRIDRGERSATEALVADALDDGGQCLVFVNARREARELAASLADTLDVQAAGDRGVADGGSTTETSGGAADAEDAGVASALRDSAETIAGEALADVADDGVAFHHAGLAHEHRSLVETGFRSGELRVLCATPTLAAGVNVPARRVIVRDHERYGDAGYEPLSPLEVRQMFGRAGRPGLDPYGEAILVADDAVEQRSTGAHSQARENDDEREQLRERYFETDPAPVTSKLDDPRALRTHVLAAVAGGVAGSRARLADLLAETFCAHCGDGDDLQATAADAIDRLVDAGMLVDDAEAAPGQERASAPDEPPAERLVATDLGALVSRVYVDPATGADVVAALERADDLDRITPLTVCEIVCDTAEMPTRYVGQAEAGELTEFAMRAADELARPVAEFEGNFHAWLSALKTARLLAEYVDGAPLDRLVEGYNVGPGDVRRFAERAEWLLAATESLAEHVDSDATERIRDTRERLVERVG